MRVLNKNDVKPHTLEYTPTDHDSVAELRGAIEREIKQSFDRWRPHGVPTWNFNASKTLKDLLVAYVIEIIIP